MKAIRECAAFLVIMTPEAGVSRWVEREVMLADELQKPMFPVLLSGDLHTCELWALFIGKQYEDARGDKLPADRFYAKLALSAPKKTVPPNDGWLPKFDDPEVSDEKLEKTVAEFTKRHLGRLRELREQQMLNPPDLSSILPPPFEWCEIPAGKVTIEYSDTDHKTFEVLPFLMAMYPITNAQYQVFLEAEEGYRDPSWWGFSDEAKLWRRENRQPEKTAFEGDELPRTNVAWYEAIAFSRWLSFKLMIHTPALGESLGQSLTAHENLITLPMEQQWQRAAQGDDGHEYAWGNEFDKNRCNTGASGIEQTTPVTAYPKGASPYGVMDMSGNVWEWCLTHWSNNIIDLQGDARRVLRGGSFYFNQYGARGVYRRDYHPGGRGDDIGFRVVCRPTSL